MPNPVCLAVCKAWGHICEQIETSCSHGVYSPVEKAANKHIVTQDYVFLFQIRVFPKKENNRVAWEYITRDKYVGGIGEDLLKGVPFDAVVFKLWLERRIGVNQLKSQEEHSREREWGIWSGELGPLQEEKQGDHGRWGHPDSVGHSGCGSVAQLCPTLSNPVDCSTLGFPALHWLPEFAQIRVRWVSGSQ